MIVAIYLRKSRAEEIENTIEETLHKHEEILIDFASKHSMHIEKIYKEVVSGENLYLRPEMMKLLIDVENQKYHGVLCMDIDRLGRGSMSEQGIILETFKNSNTQIITPRKTYDLNNELDEEYTEFETFIARRELKIIKRRMQQGILKSVLDGAYLSNAPYGYKNTIINKQSSLSIDNEEAKFVNIIFDMYVNKGMGCQVIANHINSLGAKPKRSSKFCRTSIMHILKNQVYIGNIVWNKKSHLKNRKHGNNKVNIINNPKDKWIIKKGIHQPIISKEIFYKAQEILSSKSHPPYYEGKIHNCFAGIIRCKLCNRTMQRRVYNKKHVIHLLCATKGCVKSTNMYYIEKVVFDCLKGYMENINLSIEKKCDCYNNEEMLKLIKNQECKLLKQKERIQEFLETGIYDEDTYKKRINVIESKIKDLKKVDLKINKKPQKNIECLNCSNLLDFYNVCDVSTKNCILKSIILSASYYKAKDWAPNQFEMLIEVLDNNKK